jgi:hypothetical protein
VSDQGLSHGWYSVRCIFKASDRPAYEERITVWLAESFEAAVRLAEGEAVEYADSVGFRFVGLAQAYDLKSEDIGRGSEVFSLVRSSDLEPSAYIDRFFATGAEFEQKIT